MTKRRDGCALAALVDEDQTIDVASVGGRRPRTMSRRRLADILQPRAEEIFHRLWDEVCGAGYESAIHAGIVLTGGGAILEGMPEIAEQIFDLPIRRGCPEGVGGLADHVRNPAYADGGRAGPACPSPGEDDRRAGPARLAESVCRPSSSDISR